MNYKNNINTWFYHSKHYTRKAAKYLCSQRNDNYTLVTHGVSNSTLRININSQLVHESANMKHTEKLILLLTLVVVSSSQTKSKPYNITEQASSKSIQCSNDSTCPTWFTCNTQNDCECKNGQYDMITCNNKKHTAAVLICHCVTYDANSSLTFAGSCFYNCEFRNKDKGNNDVYNILPKQPSILLNNSACTPFHRTGLLCGDCETGYSPLVLSYNLSCVECPDGHKNWWKFSLVGLGPLTIFYIFVVFFSINVTSSHLHGVVWFSQTIAMPAFVRIVLFALNTYKVSAKSKFARALLVLYSFWNLDFFRSILPDTCLNVSTIQALALDYLIALYPFVLILLSYCLIELYDRKCTIVIIAWKPFKKIFTFYRMTWDVRTSVIDSFATFFFLSYIKILSVSADLLIPTMIYQLGSNKSMLGLYYSPTITYFGNYHRPYTILAIIILTSFVALPTIIFILYPCNCFQEFLSLFPINWHFLHAFVDSFQGCYKDGTEPGTFDCRWFSTIMLINRLLLSIILGLTLSTMYYIYAIIVLATFLAVIINIQPFKKGTRVHFHSTDLIFFFLLSYSYVVILGVLETGIKNDSYFHTILGLLALPSAVAPIIYIIFLVGSWLVSRWRYRNRN